MVSLFCTFGDSPEAASSLEFYLLCDELENKNSKEILKEYARL